MERALKFELAQEQSHVLRDLPLLPTLQVEPPREEALRSDYFDTPDLLLWRQAASLRVRQAAGHYVQTLKSAGARRAGLFEREEYETPVAGNAPDIAALLAIVPETSPLSPVMKTHQLQEQLAPAFCTDVCRTVWLLGLPEGDEVELAIDTCTVVAGESSQSFSELELELKRGKADHLYALALNLADTVPVRLSLASKGDRGYGLLVCEKPKAVRAKPLVLERQGSVGDAFREIARNCLAQVHANEAVVASAQSPEGVHQMRVGLRRFRSALDMFSGVVTLPAGLQDEIKWIAGELGKSRDWEVLAHSTLPQVSAGEEDLPGLRRVSEAAAEIASARRHDAAEAVRSARYARLVLALGHWMAVASWQGDAEPSKQMLLAMPASELARDVLRARHRKLVRRGRGLHKLDAPRRHRARIAAKKLRYAAEFFASLFRRKSLDNFRGVLARLQDDLGWGNDMAVAGHLLGCLQQANESVSGGAIYARGFLSARLVADRENQRRLWKRFRRTERPQ